MENEAIVLVEGMTCANCAAGIQRKLTKSGYDHVNVNFATGEVAIENHSPIDLERVSELIAQAGYTYIGTKKPATTGLASIEKKLLFTLPFTIPLLAHMVVPWHVLHDPLVQLGLCLPVILLGGWHFGKSALGSLRNGVPNMDVLIFIGAMSAFLYSIFGLWLRWGTGQESQYIFFETSATIISLVLLGNVIEHRAVRQTTTAISDLGRLQEGIAKKEVLENGTSKTIEVPFGQLAVGDRVRLNTGDSIPADGVVETGELHVDESIITGESASIGRTAGDAVIGGTIVADGNALIRLTATGKSTVLAGIIFMVQKAQQEKPSMQRLADKVSAVFVPVVLGIATLTFLLANFVFGIGLQTAIMNAVAVLVISCPCAMGLATPTAVMVGLGRSAKRGILFKGAESVEQLSKVTKVVFDKTGTLTTGDIRIADITFLAENQLEILAAIHALESHSSHPIAKAVVRELANGKWQMMKDASRPFTAVEEMKAVGMKGTDTEGNVWQIGSFKLLSAADLSQRADLHVLKNGKLAATLVLEDELRHDAKELTSFLKEKGISTVLLSGDRQSKCDAVAAQLGIDTVFAEQAPGDKLRLVQQWAAAESTAMVGDGINDAPALTSATVGISLSSATQVAVNAASVVIMDSNGGLMKLKEAFQLGHHTVLTIKQNVFWAFAYNLVAIPLAAFGFLNPMVAALSMAFSDVVVIGNAIRFKFKSIE